MKCYKLGKSTFGTKEDKETYILKKILSDLEYIGTESKLSSTEKALRKLSIRDLTNIIKKRKNG